MNLTPEQLAKCREEFEAWAVIHGYLIEKYNDALYMAEYTGVCLEAFQAAWRPIPSVKEIQELLETVPEETIHKYGIFEAFAQAINRAFGGEE